MTTKEFKLSDKLYRAQFEQTTDGVFVIELGLKIVAVNPQGAAMLGYEVDELLGMSINDIVALEARNDEFDVTQYQDASNQAIYERIYRRKDGTTFPVEISISFVRGQKNTPPYIQSIVRDITERKVFETQLRISEARNRAIVDAFPDLVILLRMNGTILDVNVAESDPLYTKSASAIGKNFAEIWPRFNEQELLDQILNLGRSKPPQIFETDFEDAEGNTYEFRLSAIGGGEVLAVIRDISERAHLEQMKSDFINRASHELRTPLTTAKLMAELIRDSHDEQEIEEFWGVLLNELDRQKLLIDRLLIAGRLESNKLALESKPIELMPIIEDAISAVRQLGREKKIIIILRTEGQHPSILGDKDGLAQVFINLINNAIKFSPPEGQVTVSTHLLEEKIEVHIKDEGMGIPKKDQPNLFQKFFRAKNVTLAEIPGSGIGLYLVKAFLDELGGTIAVKSEEGNGTTFIVTLLLAQEIDSAPEAPHQLPVAN